MFEALVASRPRHLLSPWEASGSLVVHAVALTLCVLATRTTVRAVTRPVVDTTLVFLTRLAPAVSDKPLPRPGGAGASGDGSLQVILAANPPPRGFQVVNAVTAVPTEIPPAAAGERALDPRDFTGRGVEGGTGWGVVGGSGPPDQEPFQGDVREALYSADATEATFVTAELESQPEFVYPRVLLAAGVGGRVVVQFIIDTLGLVEPKSLTVLETTHAGFSEAACQGILKARFKPAHLGNRPVRQISRWPVKFDVKAAGQRPG
ncbi:MAG TPA: energy transducer TonB [Gemmatimonadales bacterium]|nr:energy transducer TonB [Gemmatimonadales bacterium]